MIIVCQNEKTYEFPEANRFNVGIDGGVDVYQAEDLVATFSRFDWVRKEPKVQQVASDRGLAVGYRYARDLALIDVEPGAEVTDPCGCNRPGITIHQAGDAGFCRSALADASS